MPLVTLTCSEQYYPPDEKVEVQVPSVTSMHTIQLAQDLPVMIIARREELGLEDDTPVEAVQVDIKKFHTYARNTVDIWTLVQLTEYDMVKLNRLRVRSVLMNMLVAWFAHNELDLTWALDIFYGPGHGCFTGTLGNIHTW